MTPYPTLHERHRKVEMCPLVRNPGTPLPFLQHFPGEHLDYQHTPHDTSVLHFLTQRRSRFLDILLLFSSILQCSCCQHGTFCWFPSRGLLHDQPLPIMIVSGGESLGRRVRAEQQRWANRLKIAKSLNLACHSSHELPSLLPPPSASITDTR